MKLNDLISKIGNEKYIKLTWLSELSSSMTKEAKRRGFIVTKQVTSIVEVDREIKKLLWGNYYQAPYLVRYNDKLYLRIISKEQPDVQYYINGTPVDRSDFDQYPVMQPSYWLNKDTKTVKEMVLNIDNITKIEVIK